MTKAKKLDWRELKKKHPKAFEKHVEDVMEWMQDDGSLTFEERPDGKLYADGHFPGDEYGGSILTVWTGKHWEETVDEYDDEEQDDDEDGTV